MKYGPIIYDPKTEEAKALIGKEVIGSDFYFPLVEIDEDLTMKGVLTSIREVDRCPFQLDDNECRVYFFIREVIE